VTKQLFSIPQNTTTNYLELKKLSGKVRNFEQPSKPVLLASCLAATVSATTEKIIFACLLLVLHSTNRSSQLKHLRGSTAASPLRALQSWHLPFLVSACNDRSKEDSNSCLSLQRPPEPPPPKFPHCKDRIPAPLSQWSNKIFFIVGKSREAMVMLTAAIPVSLALTYSSSTGQTLQPAWAHILLGSPTEGY